MLLHRFIGIGGIIPMVLVVLHHGVIIFVFAVLADFNHQSILKVVI
jgi:hypothetical protein